MPVLAVSRSSCMCMHATRAHDRLAGAPTLIWGMGWLRTLPRPARIAHARRASLRACMLQTYPNTGLEMCNP